jgi:acyl-CoA thioester hydrolase
MADSTNVRQGSGHSAPGDRVSAPGASAEPVLTGVYTRRFAVPHDAIDVNGHVNNLAYVAWMQEIAIEHSAAAGWPLARYQAIGAAWVVRSHFVEYLRPLFQGDPLAVHTWVPRFDQRATPRRYLFVRESDRREVARAETAWVFVDLATGKRRGLPAELLAAFHPLADDAVVRAAVGLGR